MRTHSAYALIAILALAQIAAADEKTETDLKAISGTWRVVSIEMDGEKRDLPQDEAQVAFMEGKLLQKDEEIFNFKIDASTSPKIIDFTKSKDPDKDQMLEGIYKFDGEMLIVCLWNGMGVKSRPAEFEAKPGSNFVLVTLKKA